MSGQGEATIPLGRLFASMGLMYAWATKEYLLWEMDIGQIILYHNVGMEIRNPKAPETPGLTGMGADELRKMRDEIMPRPTDSEIVRKYGEGAIDG